MLTIRPLIPDDLTELQGFLDHPTLADSSMFLRSHLRQAGLAADQGLIHQATWFGSFTDNRLTGVATLAWSGNVVLQAPGNAALLAPYIAAAAHDLSRPIGGIVGPADQVQAMRAALGVEDWPTNLDIKDDLFTLPLDSLRVPEALRLGAVQCRLGLPQERELLIDWRRGYDQHTLGQALSEEAEAKRRDYVDRQLAEGGLWVLTVDGQPVALSAFNARLPDVVQIGGVWTPPELRGKGYARAVVAGSLLAVREHGVTRAILFAHNPFAISAYTSLGFKLIGDYSLLMFATPTLPAISATASASASEAVRPGLSMP